MADSDLTSPLGAETGPARRLPAIPFLPIGGGLVGLLFLIALGWVVIVDDPFGGEPVAVVAIDTVPSVGMGQIGMSGMSGMQTTVLPEPDAMAAAQSDGGPRIIRVDNPSEAVDDGEPGDVVIRDLSTGAETSGSPLVSVGADERLSEAGPHGALPKVAADGTRPMVAYGRPAPKGAVGQPRIAVVVSGLGLSQTATQEAIRMLPSDVTLAFAPYGNSLSRWVGRARQDGHEILLQLPLEPFDYPDNDPGPHTLLTSLAADANADRLHWLMARMNSYAGVMNYMGARFTATPTALDPLLAELAKRGLYIVDDGSSSRSLTATHAPEFNLPFARGDLVIDTMPSKDEIDARLLRLETLAQTHGYAVGIASGLPITVGRIAEWAKTLRDRGFLLVPASAIAANHKD
ncbi:MAG: divergent polysaccharide deacetylase family protein [Hyphomicrobiales bacterium]